MECRNHNHDTFTNLINLGQVVSRFVLIAVLIGVAASITSAQNITFSRSSFSNGLPSSYIYSIVSDSVGQIWIGTNNGISRYNGKSFRSYSTENGLAHDKIRASICDDKGNVWIGHVNGSVTVFRNGRFERLGSELNIQDNIVLSIYEDTNGVLWFGTLGSGLIRYDGEAQTFQEQDGISGEGIFDITQDSWGRYWIATEKGITIVDGDLGTTGRVVQNTRISGLEGGLLRCLLPTEQGMLVGTRERGVLLASNVESLTNITFRRLLANALGSVFVYTMHRDEAGRIWAGTYGSGLILLRRDANTGEWQSRTYTKEHGLSNNFVQAIAQDREGNIWIGTNGGGICQMKEEAFSVIDENSGLPSNMVLSVYQDRQGTFWFGTDEGLVRYDQPTAPGESPSITNFSQDIDNSLRRVVAISEDNDGKLWLGTESEGAVLFDPERQSVDSYKSELGASSVSATLVDSKGNVWFATDGQGVKKYNPTANEILSFSVEEGLTDTRVNVVFEDSQGNIWIGTEGGFLFRREGEGQFERVLEEEWTTYAPITSIAQDGEGYIWIATDGDGVFRMQNTKVKHFDTGHGLPSDNALSVMYDEAYNLVWVGTREGVASYDVSLDSWQRFGAAEGFTSSEMNRNAIHYDELGNVLFGSVAGVVRFVPGGETLPGIPPSIEITRMRLMSRDTILADGVRIDNDQNYLQFEFEAISMKVPDAVVYSYQLEGQNADWSRPTKRNVAAYSNLEPGNYTFKVRAGLTDGTWGESLLFSFTIAPPWYLQPVFQVAVVLLLSLIVVSLVFIRSKRIRRENIALEQAVQQRTVELEKQTELLFSEKQRIEQINEELIDAKARAEAASQAKSIFLANVTHELRTPMNSILGFTRRVLRGLNKEDEKSRKALSIVYDNSERLLQLINDILDFSVGDAGRLSYSIVACDPTQIFKQVVDEMQPKAVGKGLTFHYEAQDSATISCDPDRLRQVLLNIVDNAVKFTDEGSITFNLAIEHDAVLFSVRDTGRGIAEEKLDTIFKAFEQAVPVEDRLKGGMGLGLSIANRFVVDMGGNILVHSSASGSEFIVQFPLIENKET